MRVLYARVGKAFCPIDGLPIQQYNIDEIIDFIESNFSDNKISLYSPVIRGRKGDYATLIEGYINKGYDRAIIDGKEVELSKAKDLHRYKNHDISILIDRINLPDEGHLSEILRSRISESVEASIKESDGQIIIIPQTGEKITFSTKFSCAKGHIFEELEPRLFSFNSPFGACKSCSGLGYRREVDPNLIIPDYTKTIDSGAILPWSYAPFNYYGSIINSIAKKLNVNASVPLKNISSDKLDFFLYGQEDSEPLSVTYYSQGRPINFNMRFNGLVGLLESRYLKTDSEAIREEIGKYMSQMECETCHGKRLKEEALSVKVGGKSIDDISSMSIDKSITFFENLSLNTNEELIASRLLKEITSRLNFLKDVGLNYLTLSRFANTLSGGETQRIRLASQIGSGLVGVLYVLDEPSIGLHQKDNKRLLETLCNLRDLGNSVIVIEHDEETMREADFIVDVGPGAGSKGGEIVATGDYEAIISEPRSITGQYLKGEKKIAIPSRRRKLSGNYIEIKEATEHNLKNISVKIPTANLIVVTGVSGSGKSTLVNDVLYRGMLKELSTGWRKPGAYKEIIGKEYIDKVIDIDQSPIGRTPRSNPATYTKAFDIIRELFASTKEAQIRGYRAGRFSFNVSSSHGGGRCEKCRGDGVLKIEMHFLPDVFIPCDLCRGKRYNKETLEVKYKGKNVADILDMTVDEADEIFSNIPPLADKIKVLKQVGLGYIKLGQSATTLSGGEAQRIKLSSELSKRATGKTLYILDEPTTGLHFEDVNKLIQVLNKLVDSGNTVVIIEHNLDVIKVADHIIDLGPEGGDEGGKIVAAGTPEMVSGIKSSYTGQYLKKVLSK
jgi:excinuclease ABC subunit A